MIYEGSPEIFLEKPKSDFYCNFKQIMFRSLPQNEMTHDVSSKRIMHFWIAWNQSESLNTLTLVWSVSDQTHEASRENHSSFK